MTERWQVRYEFAGASGKWGDYDTKEEASQALIVCWRHFNGRATVWLEPAREV